MTDQQINILLKRINPNGAGLNENCGGCGFAALWIYNCLLCRGIEAELVSLGKGVSIHVLVKITRKGKLAYLDTSGIHTSKSLKVYYGGCGYSRAYKVDKTALIKLLGNRDIWNGVFDRRNLQKLNRYITGTFS